MEILQINSTAQRKYPFPSVGRYKRMVMM